MIRVYVIASNKGQKPVKTTDLANMIDFGIGYISGTNKFLESWIWDTTNQHLKI
jgi:hypothetical protein